MLVNLKYKEKFPLLKKWLRMFNVITLDFGQRFLIKKVYYDSKKLKKFFKLNYPQLTLDKAESTLCTSCKLCENVCPTKAIEIVKPNMINFPSSLVTGEAPLHFYLDTTKCTQCALCASVCYVNAIELSAIYQTDKVDLTQKS